MSPYIAWVIAELTKLAVQRIADAGKFNSLTQAEAEAMVVSMSDGLSTVLPSPEDLEKP